MKKISNALTFILIAGAAFAAQAQSVQPAGIKVVDFSNFTYRTSFAKTIGEASLETIRLKNGKFENGGMLFELFDKPVYGDLNGDNSEDAVVELKASGAPTYRGFEVYAYAFQKGAAKLLARVDDTLVSKDYRKYYPKTDLHYAGGNSPQIKNGRVTIEALTEGSFACPKYIAVFDYKLAGGKFVLSGKPIRKPSKCGE